jgi:hypothetical protein
VKFLFRKKFCFWVFGAGGKFSEKLNQGAEVLNLHWIFRAIDLIINLFFRNIFDHLKLPFREI